MRSLFQKNADPRPLVLSNEARRRPGILTSVRVGVDATSWANQRGFGRFARNAIGRLIELDQSTRYVLYIDEQSAAGVDLPDGAQERRVSLGRPPAEAAAADSSRSPRDLLQMTRAVYRDRLDAFLFPSVNTWFPVMGTPTVVGVHDVIAHRLPHLTLPTRRARAFWQIKEKAAIRTAQTVFTVSEASRTALAEEFGLAAHRLAVVSEAPDAVFVPGSGAAVAAALAPLGLERDHYFLFVGGISPHKNLPTLLEAYARLRLDSAGAPPLVLVGELERDPYLSATTEVRARITALGLNEHVVLTGFVSDETLACLYTGAAAVVLPSLDEGFDLPAVEAAACGAPVLLSDLPAHQETLGGAALFFPATDPVRIASQMARVLEEPKLREELSGRARSAVAGLSWDSAAQSLQRVVADAAASRGARRPAAAANGRPAG